MHAKDQSNENAQFRSCFFENAQVVLLDEKCQAHDKEYADDV